MDHNAALRSLAAFHDEQAVLEPAAAVREAEQIIEASVNSTVKEISAADASIQVPVAAQKQQVQSTNVGQEIQQPVETQNIVDKENMSAPERVDREHPFEEVVGHLNKILDLINLPPEEKIIPSADLAGNKLKIDSVVANLEVAKQTAAQYLSDPQREKTLQELADAPLNTPEDIQAFNVLLEHSAEAVQVSRAGMDALAALKDLHALNGTYVQQMLEERGLSNESIYWVSEKMLKNIQSLSSTKHGFGRVLNRREIKNLKKEVQSRSDTQAEIDARPSEYSIDKEDLYGMGSVMNKFSESVIDVTTTKIFEYYAGKGMELIPKHPEEVSPELTSNLTEVFLNNVLAPRLATIASAEGLTDADIQNAQDIMRQEIKLPQEKLDWETYSSRIDELKARKESLPEQVQDVLNKYQTSNGTPYNIKETAREFVLLLDAVPIISQRNEIFSQFEKVESDLKKLLMEHEKLPGSYLKYERERGELFRNIHRRTQDDNPQLGQLSTDNHIEDRIIPRWQIYRLAVDGEVWKSFLESDAFLELYDRQTLQKADQILSDRTREVFAKYEYSSDNPEMLAFLKDEKSAALILMSIYGTKHGYHLRNKIIALQRHNPLGPKPEDEPFMQYFTELTPEDINRMRQSDMPEIADIVDMIREDPIGSLAITDSDLEDIYTEDGKILEDKLNPAYIQAVKGLRKDMPAFLNTASTAEKQFVLRSLVNFWTTEASQTFGIVDSLVTDQDKNVNEEAGRVLTRFASSNAEFARLSFSKLDSLSFKQRVELFQSLTRNAPIFIEALNSYQGTIPRELAANFIYAARAEDPTLSNINDIPEEKIDQFAKSLPILVGSLTEGRELHQFIKSANDIFRFIARQPEKVNEVIELPEKFKPLFGTLLVPGGPLYANSSAVIADIFSNGNPTRRAQEIETIFTKKVPYWRQLYLFTNTRLGDELAAAQTEYSISEISGVSLVRLAQRYKELKAIDPNILTRLETAIDNKDTLGKLVNGNIENVPFKDFSGMYKKLIFRDFLRRSIETSRSSGAKDDADRRNRESVVQNFELKPEMYLHGFYSNNFDNILLSGNLPGEALGEMASKDSYPFQVDFTRITSDHLSRHNNLNEQVLESLSGSYGDGTYLVYERNDASWEAGKNAYGGGDYHALLLGGMPATEISAVLLKDPETLLEKARKSVVENGFYIPIYDLSGNLLLTSQEYDSIRAENNLDIPVEVWDYSLKTGEQLGSNPGGEFTIPEMGGPEKYYVKFVDPENWEHMWSEELTDNIYRQLGVPIPETKIVKVSGTYGHASKVLPIDEVQNQDDLKNGFLADALLANWDAVYNSANNLVSGGRTYRIDNGGSLFFRARGDRKTGEMFGEVVNELQSGTDKERLGLGMRQMYPGLTDEDIRLQAENMRSSLTDSAIDNVVNSVRLPKTERDQIALTLKKRRDYILSQAIPSVV